MIKSAAVLFGIVFLLVGILGFVPGVAPDQMLFKIFHVNAAHNIVHIGSGIIFLIVPRRMREHPQHGSQYSE
jgi:hypothetical protein